MEARAPDSRLVGYGRLTTGAAALALMFNEVSVATERLALCLRTQRRIGAAHALLHLRRLVAACQRDRATGAGDANEIRGIVSLLAHPLKALDDALAADRLESAEMAEAERHLSFVRFQLWRLERLSQTARGADPSSLRSSG